MKFRTWVNLITAILLVLAVYLARDQIFKAWGLMGEVNLWIFSLLIPIQLFSYYAVGEVMFTYLRSKGNLKKMTRWSMTRTALELNFVNHIIPIPSVAGFSYLGWVLNRYGVSVGRATMAQIIRYVMMFASFVVLIVLSVIVVSFDGKVDRTVVIISALFVIGTIASFMFLIYIIGNKKRIMTISSWITDKTNKIISFFTFGKKTKILELKHVETFFIDLHQDYVEIVGDKKILISPLMWAVLGNILDVLLIWVAFISIGYAINPATLFIAYGISSFAAIFAATPGGSGIYEAIMIAFLATAGVPAETAIAGTLLARVTLFAGTVIFGYIFYQLTINKYGKINQPTDI